MGNMLVVDKFIVNTEVITMKTQQEYMTLIKIKHLEWDIDYEWYRI